MCRSLEIYRACIIRFRIVPGLGGAESRMPKAYIYMCTCILCLSVKSRLRNHNTSSGFSRTRKLHFGTSCIPSRGLFIDTTTLGSSAKRSVNNTASPPPHQSSAKPGGYYGKEGGKCTHQKPAATKTAQSPSYRRAPRAL